MANCGPAVTHFPAFGLPLIQATSILNGPAFLSARRKPTASTLLAFSGFAVFHDSAE